MITEQKIKSFLLLAQELNFSRAAQQLYISQQALSAQIAGLENDLGVQLFTRTTKTVCLTEAGQRLAEFFRRSAREFQEILGGYQCASRTLLRIGCFENLDLGSMLFQARDALLPAYPNLSCQLSVSANFSTLFQRLEARDIDVAIMPLGVTPSADFSSQVLADDVTFAFFSKSYPGWEKVHSLLDLRDSLLFAGPEYNGLWQYLHTFFQQHGIKANLSYDPGSSILMERMLVESGEGVGFGGRYSLLYRNQELIRIPLALKGELGGVWRKDSSNPIVRPYLKALSALF